MPYVVWCLAFAGLVSACVLMANIRAHKPWATGLDEIFSWNVLGFDFCRWPLLVPFWYIRALLILCVLSPVLIGLVRKAPRLLFSVLGLASLLFTGWAGSRVPLFFVKTISPFSIFCFCTGLALRVFEGRFVTPGTRFSLVLLGLGGSVLVLDILLRYSGISLPVKLEVVFVSFILLGIWRFIPAGAWSWGLASEAFTVFCMHFMFLYLVRLMVRAPSNGAVYILCLSVVGVLGPLICARCLRRFTPKIAVIVFGGR